jgi:hypothetical protein
MGPSGHAFIAHTKALSPRAQPKDGGYGLPPHPLSARAGQVYWPRGARTRRLLVVRSVRESRVVIAPADDRRAATTISIRRLMATRADGQGLHFQFQGFAPRRYDTNAYVWSMDADEAVLCLPEWHAGRPVRMPARLLPPAARHGGAWLKLRCDLSASSAARLQPSRLTVAAEHVAPPHLHRPGLDGCLGPHERCGHDGHQGRP